MTELKLEKQLAFYPFSWLKYQLPAFSPSSLPNIHPSYLPFFFCYFFPHFFI